MNDRKKGSINENQIKGNIAHDRPHILNARPKDSDELPRNEVYNTSYRLSPASKTFDSTTRHQTNAHQSKGMIRIHFAILRRTVGITLALSHLKTWRN